MRVAFLIFAAIAFSAAGGALAGRGALTPDVEELTERLDSLQRRRQELEGRLSSVRTQQRRVTRELDRIDAKLQRAEQSLREVGRSMSQTRSALSEATREAKAAELRLANHRDSVAARLVAVYQQGEVTPVAVLVNATSYTDFANRLYLLNQVVSSDARLLEELEEALADAYARRERVRAEERRLAGLQEQIAVERRQVAEERTATEREKERILRDRAAWERALAELEEDSREIEAMLQRLQRTPEGQDRLTTPWIGRMLRPVEGRISSGYGYRMHPIFRVRRMHTGIDVAAPAGTPIRAAAPGVVVHAGRWGGYGNCVILDHGGGLATLYAHCSELAVAVGQEVSQGQIIGYVGSTGLATGPHLHFEVRRDGRPVDPSGYL